MRVIYSLRVAISVVLVSCGGAQTSELRPVVAENRRPEARELPADVRDESLPEGVPAEPGEDYVVPVEVGECIPAYGRTVPSSDEEQVIPGPCPEQSGIMVSEARANRDALYRIRYRELREISEADRRVWSAHRELYEAQVAADREEIDRLQPTFWEQHDGEVMAVLGLIAGSALTTFIVWAVNQVTE